MFAYIALIICTLPLPKSHPKFYCIVKFLLSNRKKLKTRKDVLGRTKQSCGTVFWDLVTEFNFPVRKERRAAPRVERGREKNGIERRAKGARLARRCDCHDSFQNTFECAHPPSLFTNYARVTENRSICMSICPVEKLSRQLQFMVLQSE